MIHRISGIFRVIFGGVALLRVIRRALPSSTCTVWGRRGYSPTRSPIIKALFGDLHITINDRQVTAARMSNQKSHWLACSVLPERVLGVTRLYERSPDPETCLQQGVPRNPPVRGPAETRRDGGWCNTCYEELALTYSLIIRETLGK